MVREFDVRQRDGLIGLREDDRRWRGDHFGDVDRIFLELVSCTGFL